MITLRDKYHVEEDGTETPNVQERLDQMRDYGVSLPGLKACYALTALTNGCPDLASYPSEETVRALAGSYMDPPKKRRF